MTERQRAGFVTLTGENRTYVELVYCKIDKIRKFATVYVINRCFW